MVGNTVGMTLLEELCSAPLDVCCVGLTVGRMLVGRIVVGKTMLDCAPEEVPGLEEPCSPPVPSSVAAREVVADERVVL